MRMPPGPAKPKAAVTGTERFSVPQYSTIDLELDHPGLHPTSGLTTTTCLSISMCACDVKLASPFVGTTRGNHRNAICQNKLPVCVEPS